MFNVYCQLEASGGILWKLQRNFGFHKLRMTLSLLEQLSVYQEGMYAVQLFIQYMGRL